MTKKIRYGVVGLGYISQAAVLPGFKHARKNSTLSALISDDSEKLKVLSRKYGVDKTYSYDTYDDCLRNGEIDAVYIALPNSMHRDYAVKAAKAGIHVLCEKPMAMTQNDCEAMIEAAHQNGIKLMVAYRLHFEAANLAAIRLVQSGQIGEPRYFYSSFSQQVKPDDIRLQKSLGGGSVFDMGVYCLNAARYMFRSEPREISAFSAGARKGRFKQVDEMTSVMMRFPGERLATFTSSFGAADTSYYRIVGTRGDLVLEPAYDYSLPLQYTLTLNGHKTIRRFPRSDQFAAELLYFSNCILRRTLPEPSGEEGLADVRIVDAIYRSARRSKVILLDEYRRALRPQREQEIGLPAIKRLPRLIHAASASGD